MEEERNIADVYEGYVRLACEIGETRANAYRQAFREFFNKPSKGTLFNVLAKEKKLKGPITCLDDAGIESIQRQVIGNRYNVHNPALIMLWEYKYLTSYHNYTHNKNTANLTALQHWEQRLRRAGRTTKSLENLLVKNAH